MRLIDADATLKRLKAIEDAHRQIKELGACHGLLMAQEVVMESETIEPKIGRWIEDAKTYYEELNKRGLGVDEYTPYFTDDIACSECLAKYSTIDNETEFFKFCPNCGARMESEIKRR